MIFLPRYLGRHLIYKRVGSDSLSFDLRIILVEIIVPLISGVPWPDHSPWVEVTRCNVAHVLTRNAFPEPAPTATLLHISPIV